MLYVRLGLFHQCFVIFSKLFILLFEIIALSTLAQELNLQTLDGLFSRLPPRIDLIKILLHFMLFLGSQLNLPPQISLVLLKDLE